MKKALITGVTGQDGSYLVDLLIEQGYEVHGLIRQSTQFTPDKWGHLRPAMQNDQLNIHYGDVTDALNMRSLIEKVEPDEIYNLAAQSHVGLSFDQPQNTTYATAMGPLNILEAIRHVSPKTIKFYQASSSEMFGRVVETPQNELTRFYPRSPYGCAKVYGHYITQNYREAYGIFACSGILFNHESERRGENFVTRKITRAIGRILTGQQKVLSLGNMSACRDWGYAPDYVDAMHRMMQHHEPSDFVIGTGEVHSVQEFLDTALRIAGLEQASVVVQDPRYMRPAEVDTLRADASRARDILGWKPSVGFKSLVTRMVDYDRALALREARNK